MFYQKKISIILFSISLFVWIGFTQVSLEFPDSLETTFTGYTDNQSSLHFNYDGNNFEWIIFPSTTTLITWVDITLSGVTIENCKKQVEWLYYSNARWQRIWPLDNNHLLWLSGIDSSYSALDITGWFFFDCSWVNSNNIYWQIKHTLDGNSYYLIAWVNYNTSNNSYNSTFGGTTMMSGNDIIWHIFDDKAGIALLKAIDFIALQGSFSPILWTHLKQIDWLYYSDQNIISIQISANKIANYSVQWNIASILTWNTPSTTSPSLSGDDGAKTIQVSFSTWTEIDTASMIINLDKSAPSTIYLTNPSSGTTVINYTGGISISRTWWIDAGIWINNYFYNIINSSWTTIISWNTSNKNINVSISTWIANYSWIVYVSDLFGNTSKSLTWHFFITTGTLDNSPESFDLRNLYNAKPSKVYQSNIIVVKWLYPWVFVKASVDAGVLFINWIFSSTWWQVGNGDLVRVERISNTYYADDSHYDDKANSTWYDSYGNPRSILTIWNKSDSFVIKNMDEDEDQWDATQYENALTNSIRWTIREAFQELTDAYDNKSLSRQREVFLALENIIKDKMLNVKLKIKTTHSKSSEIKYKKQLTILSYLYEYTVNHLTDNLDLDIHLLDNNLDEENNYIAPNGNKYKIEYSDQKWYYSKDIKITKYFATIDQIKSYIDINNPNSEADISERIIAPNWKEYSIIKNKNGEYGSLYFKNIVWFQTLNWMIRYITINNPYNWNDCDYKDKESYTVSYTTPSGKNYNIDKSIKWKYYSNDTSANFCYEYLNDLVAVLDAFNE